MKPSAPVTSTVRPVVDVAELAGGVRRARRLSRGCRSAWSVRFRVGEQAYRVARLGLPGERARSPPCRRSSSTGFAAVVGVVIAREFGRTEETDGFFAAYGVFIVIVLASQAIRARGPATARVAPAGGRLRGEVAGFGIALAVAALPFLVLGEVAARPVADLLTGSGSATAQDVVRRRAALARARGGSRTCSPGSPRAAWRRSTTTRRRRSATRSASAAALVEILTRVDDDGIAALYRGVAVNGAIALAVPVLGLAVARGSARGCHGRRFARRVARSVPGSRVFATAAALPIALQLLYVVCLPFAGRVEPGAVTSFGYAYLAAASFVSITAFSIGLVSSVPLTRTGSSDGAAARHVDRRRVGRADRHRRRPSGHSRSPEGRSSKSFSATPTEATSARRSDASSSSLAPWMVASVGVNVSFPLAFVAGRLRELP